MLNEGQNLIHKVHGGVGDILGVGPLAGLEFRPDRNLEFDNLIVQAV